MVQFTHELGNVRSRSRGLKTPVLIFRELFACRPKKGKRNSVQSIELQYQLTPGVCGGSGFCDLVHMFFDRPHKLNELDGFAKAP